MKGKWDQKAYAKEMRRSTQPVSAFFLISSLESIPKCIKWLSVLQQYGMPSLEDSPYFRSVREIYESGKKAVNFDYEFKLLWKSLWKKQELQAMLRCHFIDKGRYEIELILPGVLANAIADKFKNGYEGFSCSFMPPGFYD